MIDHERLTYEAWLAQPLMILDALDRCFEPVTRKTSLGKLHYVGRKRPFSQLRSAASRAALGSVVVC
jgi:hypothetical protein